MEVLSFALTDEEHEVQVAAARGLGRLCSAPYALRADDGARASWAARARTTSSWRWRCGRRARWMSAAHHDRRAIPAADLVLGRSSRLAREAPSPVAIASVDALGHACHARALGAALGIAAALDHADEDVVKAALLKLADCRGVSRARPRRRA